MFHDSVIYQDFLIYDRADSIRPTVNWRKQFWWAGFSFNTKNIQVYTQIEIAFKLYEIFCQQHNYIFPFKFCDFQL